MSRHDDTDSESDSGAVAGHPLPASPRARRGIITSDSDSDSKETVKQSAGAAPAAAAAAAAPASASSSRIAAADSSDGAKEKGREIFTWRIPLNQWRMGNKDREYSPDFELDGETWRLLCFPKGNQNHSVAGCMGGFLELRDPRASYSTACHFKMKMVHPSEPSRCVWREADHTFTNTETDRGFNDLLTPATLAEYTHADGCVVLNVSAWKMPHPHPHPLIRAARYAAPPRAGVQLTSTERTALNQMESADRELIERMLLEEREARQRHWRRRDEDESDEEEEIRAPSPPVAARLAAVSVESPPSATEQPQPALDQPTEPECKVPSPAPESNAKEESTPIGSSDGQLQCHLCMAASPDALTLCCSVLRVCGGCMSRLLQMQAEGKAAPRCPNCNCGSSGGKPFGRAQIVWRVKL